MKIIYGRDIFNTAYSYVKDLLLQKRTKSSSLSETKTDEYYYEDTENSVVKKSDPTTTTDEGAKDSTKRKVESTVESVEKTLEEGAETALKDELEDRFPFILAAVCSDLAKLDAAYRAYRGEDEQEEFSEFSISLISTFPLSERFCFPCTMYVCSMFLIDSYPEASDRFFAKYSDLVSEISNQIPFENGGIIEKYPY